MRNDDVTSRTSCLQMDTWQVRAYLLSNCWRHTVCRHWSERNRLFLWRDLPIWKTNKKFFYWKSIYAVRFDFSLFWNVTRNDVKQVWAIDGSDVDEGPLSSIAIWRHSFVVGKRSNLGWHEHAWRPATSHNTSTVIACSNIKFNQPSNSRKPLNYSILFLVLIFLT